MKTAFKLSIPAVFCYFSLGVVYGLLFTQNGFPWYWAPIFSAFVYAGAMQFLAFTVLLTGGSLLTLALALIPLGFRNIFYGMTLLERFQGCHPLLRAYLAHGLVDATYSILITGPHYEDEKQDLRYITTLTVLIHLSWILGTLLGTFIDYLVVLPPGLEFALTAFFAASAVEQIRKKREFKPILIAAASLVIATYFMPSHLFLGALSLAAVSLLVLPVQKEGVA